MRMNAIGFFLNVSDVFRLGLLVFQTGFMGVQQDIFSPDIPGNILSGGKENGLRNAMYILDVLS